MKETHYFIPALDVSDLLPFGIKQKKQLRDVLDEQDRARGELMRFISILEKNMKQQVVYLGLDVIGEKNYERFLFQKEGFIEVMAEAPVALNAHFVTEKSAQEFLKAFKKTLLALLPKGPMAELFVDHLEVQNMKDMTLDVSSWNKMKKINKK